MRAYQVAMLLALTASRTGLSAQQATSARKNKSSRRILSAVPIRLPSGPSDRAFSSGIYPYFAYDDFTSRPSDQTWNIVSLENPYIR